MAYLCRDCSYRGQKSAPGGCCAACGSFNLSVERAADSGENTLPLWHKIGLVTTWSLLVLLIAWKLIH